DLIHVGVLTLIFPGAFAGDVVAGGAQDVGHALGAIDAVRDIRSAVFLLAAVQEAAHPVGPFIGDGEVVVDLAIGRVDAHLSAAGADAFHARHVVFHAPANLVDGVDGLLDNVVAR